VRSWEPSQKIEHLFEMEPRSGRHFEHRSNDHSTTIPRPFLPPIPSHCAAIGSAIAHEGTALRVSIPVAGCYHSCGRVLPFLVPFPAVSLAK
jgi:hypothetical protein